MIKMSNRKWGLSEPMFSAVMSLCRAAATPRRFNAAALIAFVTMAVFPAAANADTVAVLVSPVTGQNARLTFVDTAAAVVVGEVVLPYTRQVYFGGVLNLGHTVYVSTHDQIHEIDVASMTMTRTMSGSSGCNASLDRMLMDPRNPSRLFVVAYHGGVCTVDLNKATIAPFVAGSVTAAAIRPDTRELFVGFWGDSVRAYDMDSGVEITARQMFSKVGHGVHDLDFVDANTLLVGGYGVAKFDLATEKPSRVFESHDGDAGWGYDWTLTGDGKHILQPGWMASRVRRVSDMSVVSNPGIEATNFYYGSAASGQDGTFVLTGGDLNGYNSPGRGVLLIGYDATLKFSAKLAVGDSKSTVIVRGSPYHTGIVDSDGDGVPDDVDAFPNDPNESQDTDDDGVGDRGDNCAAVPNPSQANYDGDDLGDDCDADDDNDGLTDGSDPMPRNADSDGDGILDGADPYVQSDASATVTVNGVGTGVANRVIAPGTTLADEIAASVKSCAIGAKNSGAYVSCMAHVLNVLNSSGIITGAEKGRIQSAIASRR